MKKGMTNIGVVFDDKQLAELRAIANADGGGGSVGALVRDAVDLYLEKRRQEAEKKRAEAEEARQLTEKVIAELQSVFTDHPSEERLALLESMRERLKADLSKLAHISDPPITEKEKQTQER